MTAGSSTVRSVAAMVMPSVMKRIVKANNLASREDEGSSTMRKTFSRSVSGVVCFVRCASSRAASAVRGRTPDVESTLARPDLRAERRVASRFLVSVGALTHFSLRKDLDAGVGPRENDPPLLRLEACLVIPRGGTDCAIMMQAIGGGEGAEATTP